MQYVIYSLINDLFFRVDHITLKELAYSEVFKNRLMINHRLFLRAPMSLYLNAVADFI
jgi:hypothetical protein